jgi:dTDP-4-amino-4,6-dideoxy-D-galactose acyltransferase
MESAVCRYLEWDSEFFGLRIARLTEDSLTRDRTAAALRWCTENRIDCLYFLAQLSDSETAELAQLHGLQPVDMRVTLDCALPAAAGEAPDIRHFATSDIRHFAAADAEALCRLAAVSHRDSRFYFDSRFPRSRCDALYAAWIKRSFEGWADAVFVAAPEGNAVGYLSAHLSPAGVGSIGLVAVDPDWHGRGLGKQLVEAGLRYFAENGMKQATVVTQGRNIVSQRLYQRCGFRTRSAGLWYHRWFGDQAA